MRARIQRLRGGSDATRRRKRHNDYAHLVKDVNDEQLALIATMKAGALAMWDYHIQSPSAHREAASRVNIKSLPT